MPTTHPRPLHRATVPALIAAAALSGCIPAAAVTVGDAAPTVYASSLRVPRPAGALSEHVIVISIDGLRPDAIERFGARALQRLAHEGSYSLEARTILPSITLPSHTSMLTGEGPETHGITWNDNRAEVEGTVHTPTVFSLAHARGLHTAAFFSKGKFEHLLIPGSVTYAVAPEGNGKWLAARTAGKVEAYLRTERPDLLFVHLGDTDYAGHAFGWMGMVYGWAVRHADGAVARVLAAADRAYGEGSYTVLVTADHGGHGRTHGTSAAVDVTIPWIAWGRGIRSGGVRLGAGIRTMDTAATALRLLGVEEHAVGEPVLGALDAALLGTTDEP